LHEIVRVIEARRKVPERVRLRGKEYQITYLEDHQRRMEEAIQRYDQDRLNMLYGQLASKVKYQLLRRIPGRSAAPAKKRATVREKPALSAKKSRPAKRAVAAKKRSGGAKKRPTSRAARG